MKLNKLMSICFFTVLTFFSCKVVQNTAIEKTDAAQAIYVVQGGNKIKLDELSSNVEIERANFSIVYFNKRYNSITKEYYATRIAALLDKSELDKISIGFSINEIPYFESGTGMAASKNGYEGLIFNNIGHHYLSYEDDENKRVKLISKSGEMLELEFEINKLYYEGNSVKMEESDLEVFYLAILIERNLNGIIEDGELYKLAVKIK